MKTSNQDEILVKNSETASNLMVDAEQPKKYRIIRCDTGYQYLKYKTPPKTFEELKEQIAHAFHTGVLWVKLYTDGRKVNSYLEIKKDDFDKSFIEESFMKIQVENKIKERTQRIENLRSHIRWNEQRILEVEAEIIDLQNQVQKSKH